MKKIFVILWSVLISGCMQNAISLDGEYKLQNAKNNADITIFFENSNFSGSAGVNRYFGTFEHQGNDIKFNIAGTTMMMGPQDLMDTEQKFLNNLGQVNLFLIKGDTLILKNSSDNYMLFNKNK